MKPTHKAAWFAGMFIVTAMMVVPPSVWSDTVAGLKVFAAGETARAADVNANFTVVASAVNGNDSLIADHESRIQDLESQAGVPGPQGEEGPQGEPGLPGADGADGAELELVGFTTATFTGGEGLFGYTLACQAEFPRSRMCRSVEVTNTVNVPSGMTGSAWVRPVFYDHFVSGGGQSNSLVEISGVGGARSAYAFNCELWATNVGNTAGLSVSSLGRLDRTTCDTPLAVACCGEVGAP